MKKLSLMFRGTALAITLLVSQSASAATWFYIVLENELNGYFFDADSIEKSKGSVTLWLKLVYYKIAKDKVGSANALLQVDCANGAMQLLQMTRHDKQGKVLSSLKVAGPKERQTPDSIGERIAKMACTPDFPNDKVSTVYGQAVENDPFLMTRELGDSAAKMSKEIASSRTSERPAGTGKSPKGSDR